MTVVSGFRTRSEGYNKQGSFYAEQGAIVDAIRLEVRVFVILSLVVLLLLPFTGKSCSI